MKIVILKRVAASALLATAIAFCLLALPAYAQSYTVLHSFAGSDGQQPESGLVQGTGGNFYGTTQQGGTSGYGTVFKITPAGALTTLYSYSFAGSDGRYPRAGLLQGTDGNLYGTTEQGGTSGYGTVFKITPAGTLTTLHSFVGSEGNHPQAGLVQGIDGNLYGTTSSGGPYGYGTVFKITPSGSLTTLYLFGGDDGANPYAGLVQGTDGNFYGTTGHGGSYGNYGTIFKITPTGTLTTLRTFAGGDVGFYPYAGLVQGTDGNFYGTTSGGSASGTVFKITPAGVLTTLHSFTGSEGASPYAGLVQGSDGNFYGTTSSGGWNGHGTIFKITAAGVLTTLHLFAGGDGEGSQAGLVQGTDGYFYGTAGAGPLGGGVVFRLTPGLGPAPTVTGSSPVSGPVSGGTVVTVSGMEFQPGATVSFGGVAATGVTYFSATTIYAVTPVHAAGAVTVTVTNPDLQAGSLASAYTYTCSSWTTTAFNGGPYCAGSTISLSTPTVSGATYSWTGPNSFTSAAQNPTISNATAAKAGTYSVTATVAGCTSAASDTTVVVNTVPTPTASNTGPYCAGATISLTTPTVLGATYAWTGPNGFASPLQNPTIPAATTGATGTYSVTVTVGGCTSPSGTTNVVVKAAPATPAITAPGSTVAGTTGLTASVVSHAGGSWSWTVQNGAITSGQGTNQITFTAGTAGTPLTLSVTEANASGCVSALGNVTVTVTPADSSPPTVVITSPTSGPTWTTAATPIALSGTASDNVGVTLVTCTNSATGATVTASGTTSWSCSVPLVIGSNAGTVTARDAANNTSSNTITVTYTPSDSTPPTVTITSPTSSTTYSTSSTPIVLGGTASDNVGVTQVTCVNAATGVTVTASGTTNWSCSVGLASGGNAITVTARDAASNQGAGAITVTYASTCYGLTTAVSPAGQGSVTVNTAQTCTGGYTAGTAISLTANTPAGYTFSRWSGTGGTFSNTGTNPTTFTIASNASVTAQFTGGSPISVSVSASPNPATLNQTVTFSCNVTGGSPPYTYQWRSPSTSSFVAGTSQTIQFSSAFPTSIQAGCTAFDSAGASNASAATVQIIAGAATCVDVNYAILDRDNGYVSIPLSSGSFGQFFGVATGQNLVFQASGTGINSVDWTFGDGGTGSGNPKWYTYTTAGTFIATVTANSNAACSKSYIFQVAGPPEPPKWFVAGLAYTQGATAGTVWQSDLTILNPHLTLSATYSLAFLDGRNPVAPKNLVWKAVTLGAQESVSAANVVGPFFGKSLGSWGAVIVRGDVAPLAPAITSRTYNNGDPVKGTFGLSVPTTQATSGVSQQSSPAQQLLIGLRDDVSAYTNIALVNLISTDWSHAHLTFFDASGTNLGTLNVDVPPYGVVQLNKPLTNGLGRQPLALYRVQVTVDPGGAVYPYATVIDQTSTDPFVVTTTEQPLNTYRIPGIVRVAGANNTVWRSRFFLHNPSTSARKVSVLYSYVPCDATGCGGRKVSSGPGDLTMAAGETKKWDDFPAAWLSAAGGESVSDSVSYGNSYIDVAPASGDPNQDPLLVLGVTFNSQPTGPVGLQLSGFTDLDGGSKAGSNKRLLLTGLASNAGFRTNVALFLTSGTSGSFNVRVLSDTGVTLKTFGWNLTGSSPFIQFSDSDLFGGVNKTEGMSIIVDSFDGSPVAAYATIIDNTSGDATFVKAQPAP